jgi:hypothetical protein
MDKKLIKEDISNMKFLMGYKPGRVISEQTIKEFEYPEEESGMRKQNMQNFEKFVDKLSTNKNSEGLKSKGTKKQYGSFDDNEWIDDRDRIFNNDFDFNYDEEEFNDYSSFKEKHPDSKWFGGEKYFDAYKKQHDKPFKVRTRKGEMDEDLEFEEEETMESILEKHNLLDEVIHKGDGSIMIKDKSSEVVQKILSLLPSFTELIFLAILNCESADFSDVDICGLPQILFINLTGTENNFEEQGYECIDGDDAPFYYIP